jgi:hypothetical protein
MKPEELSVHLNSESDLDSNWLEVTAQPLSVFKFLSLVDIHVSQLFIPLHEILISDLLFRH